LAAGGIEPGTLKTDTKSPIASLNQALHFAFGRIALCTGSLDLDY